MMHGLPLGLIKALPPCSAPTQTFELPHAPHRRPGQTGPWPYMANIYSEAHRMGTGTGTANSARPYSEGPYHMSPTLPHR